MSQIFYDISQTLTSDIIVYPGDPAVKIEQTMSIAGGDIVNLSNVSMGNHTGTHIDAPKHFYDQGLTIPEIPFDYLIGRAKVFEFMSEPAIGKNHLQSCNINQGDRVLLKTKNSALLTRTEFEPSFTYLMPEAAEYLADIGIRTLGIDYLTIDSYGSKDFKAHYILLGKEIIIIEGINLSAVKPGEYHMVALPLKIQDGNGSPARVVLYREE